MPLVKVLTNSDDTEKAIVFWCSGCQEAHCCRYWSKEPKSPCWWWNQLEHAPTLSPSVLCNHGDWSQAAGRTRCHLFVRDGRLEYLADCGHVLAGQTVAMLDVDEYW